MKVRNTTWNFRYIAEEC